MATYQTTGIHQATGKGRARDYFAPLGIILIVAVWSVLSVVRVVPSVFLPPIGSVLGYFTANFGRSGYIALYGSSAGGIGGNIAYTTLDVFIGVAIACAAGISLGIASAMFRTIRSASLPVVFILGTIPVLVLGPYFLITFGVQRWCQVAIVALYSTPILYVYAMRAVSNTPQIFLQNATTLGGTRRNAFFDILLPGTFPEILGGIRIALAGSWGLAAIAEQLGGATGVGKLIGNLAAALDVTGIVACTLGLAAVAVIVDSLVAALARLLARWQ